MKALAIILIVLGALAVAYQGFSYVTREKVVDIGPLEVTAEKQKNVSLPPVLGAVVLVTGVALLLTSSRRA
jgi:Na+-transporting methylmalonyl-CoA/oxaloacetate decarboxylase gamma subunit